MAPKSTLSFFSSGACNNSFDEKPSSVANLTVGNFCVKLLYFVTLALYVRLVAAILSSNSLTDFCRCQNCLSAFNSGYASLCMRNPLTKLEASFDFFTFPSLDWPWYPDLIFATFEYTSLSSSVYFAKTSAILVSASNL